ncbi:MAG: SDR family NAD(P)-dependent oxidoreductase [Bacillota bacterium]
MSGDMFGWALGKVALVTGASSGIGRALALRLGSLGVKLVLAARREDLLNEVVSAVREGGGEAIAVRADVRLVADAERTVQAAVQRFGRVDWLINSAGVFPVTPVLEMKEEEWDAVVDTNLKGTFAFCQAVCRHMVLNGVKGKIVNISSTSSLIARPGCAHYAASKAGVVMLTRVLAVEMAPYGILVNAVTPGVIATETVVRYADSTPVAKAETNAKMARIPLRRFGEPEEIVEVVLFLLSPGSSYLTGSVIVADGGYSLGIPSY